MTFSLFFVVFSLYWKLYPSIYLGGAMVAVIWLWYSKNDGGLSVGAPSIAFICVSFVSWIINHQIEFPAAMLLNVIPIGVLYGFVKIPQRERETLLLIGIAIPIAEMLIRLAGRAMGQDWLWLEPSAPWLSPGFYGWRPLSLAGDWMDYSLWIIIVLPIAMRRKMRWYVFAALIILIMGGSRSALLALMIVLGGEWIIHRMPRSDIVMYGVWAAAFFSLIFISGINYGDRTIGHDTTQPIATMINPNGRLEMWRYAYVRWLASPWVGWGGGSFHFQSSGYESVHPHNQILWLLAEYGVVGLAVGLWWMWRARSYYEPHVMLALALYAMFNVLGGISTLTVLAIAANPKGKGKGICI